MDARSEISLEYVHPDLAAIKRAASQHPQPFIVDCGLRTVKSEKDAVASGHSKTMHSRHLPDANFWNLALACDVISATGDPFATGNEQLVFGQIAQQVMDAAKLLAATGGVRKHPNNVPAIQWGGQLVGAWVDSQVSHFRDWGHFQLDPDMYA